MEAYWNIYFFLLIVACLIDSAVFYYSFIEEKGYEMYSIGYKERKELEKRRRERLKKLKSEIIDSS